MFNKKIISLSICIVLLSAIFSGCVEQLVEADELRIVDADISIGRVFAIAEDGTFWKWGMNLTGTYTYTTPIPYSTLPVQFGTDTDWRKVDAWAIIKTDGTLWTWGRVTGIDGFIPVQVGIDTNWKEVSSCNTFALRTDGTLWELRNWKMGDWTVVQLGTDTNWKQVAGRDTIEKVGIRTDGTLWKTYYVSVKTGERNLWGQPITRLERTTTQMGTDTNWERLSACGTFAIKTDGTLWVIMSSWNDYGQLGLGHTNHTNRVLFTNIPIQIGTDAWKYVSAGRYHTLAVRRDGTLWAWGHNHRGQLGLGHRDDRASPVQVGTDTNWKRVFADHIAFSLALKTDGTLWAWGCNYFGQIGVGDVTARLYPVQVRIKPQN